MVTNAIFKVGMLVLCQFTIAQKSVENIGAGTEQPVVARIRQMTGTIRTVYPKEEIVAEMRDGKMVAVSKKSTLLEIDGDHPGWHYFLKTTACVPIKSETGQSLVLEEKPESTKHKKIESDIGLKPNASPDGVVTEELPVKSNGVEPVDPSTDIDVDESKIVVEDAPVVDKTPTKDKAEAKADKVKAEVQPVAVAPKPSLPPTNKPSSDETKAESKKEKQPGVVKGIVNDIFNNFR